jgi:hypothetical protein
VSPGYHQNAREGIKVASPQRGIDRRGVYRTHPVIQDAGAMVRGNQAVAMPINFGDRSKSQFECLLSAIIPSTWWFCQVAQEHCHVRLCVSQPEASDPCFREHRERGLAEFDCFPSAPHSVSEHCLVD